MYAGWEAIDAHERSRGEGEGRPRVKLSTWDELLAVARSAEEDVERPIDVVGRVVEVPRGTQSSAANRRADPGSLELVGSVLDVAEHDRGVARLEPEPGTEAVRERDVVLVDRVDSDLARSRSSAAAVATHMNHAGDVSSRRALAARRSGPPKNVCSGSSPAYHPAA